MSRDARTQWSQVINAVFQEVTETALNVGDIRIGFTMSSPYGNRQGGEAFPPGFFGLALSGDIWINELVASTFPFRAILHELGHVLGLQDLLPANLGMLGAKLPRELDYLTQTMMSYSGTPGATVGDRPCFYAGRVLL